MVHVLIKNAGTWTRRESATTETLRASTSFDPMGHWSMDPSGSVCAPNLPSVLIALTGNSLPFWNGEKEQTGSMFLDW